MAEFCLDGWNRLNHAQPAQVLSEEECEQLMADIEKNRIALTPGNGGRDCLGNGEHAGIGVRCDECDYLMCCFEDDLCERCFVKNGGCEIETRHSA